ncbi:hypothetical protein IAT38_005339 [Cryptococcus sp. DSM 104549]
MMASDMSPKGSPEGPSVAWLHDQEFRRAVLEGADHEQLEPPTPTQKPRPISSRFSPSSSSATGSTSRPRKRLCRAHRSLPLSNRDSSSSLAYTSGPSSLPLTGSSAPGNGEGSRTRLDMLLDQFQLQSSPMPKKTAEARHRKETEKERAIRKEKERAREKEKGRRKSERENERAGRHEARGKGKEESLSAGGSHEGFKAKAGQGASHMPTMRSHTHPNIIPPPPLFSASSTTEKLRSTTSNPLPLSRNSLSPNKPGMPPRIGLGMKPARALSSSSSGGMAFKTPFLEPKQAVRSSPRRAGSSTASSSSSSAQPRPHLPLSASREAPTLPPRTTSNPARQHPTSRPLPPSRPDSKPVSATAAADCLSGFTNFDVGEDEPEGDTSFDSLDGLFNEGGPEVEMLLRQVDGTQ